MTSKHDPASTAILEAVGPSRISDVLEKDSIGGIEPQISVSPESTNELSRTLAAAAEDGLAVAPRGGGTRMGLGGPLRQYDVSLSLSRLNGILTHSPADLTATVEAGITLDSLRQSLERHEQFLAVDAPLAEVATIGGTLAAGAIGPLKWQFGSPRDLVVGMKVVQANGTATKSGGQVVKNVSGYDMARLHIGGLGTLGVISEVSFKLTPLPQRQATLLAAFPNIHRSLTAGVAVANTGVMPLAMVAFDRKVNSRASLAASGQEDYLAVRLGGRPRTLERQIDECRRLCLDHGALSIDLVGEGETSGLWRRITDFGWSGDADHVATARVSIAPTRLAEFVDGLAPGDRAISSAVVAEPGYGGALAHWFADGAENADDDVTTHLRRARDAATQNGGQLVVERCPTAVKQMVDPWGEVGESLQIMRRMKEQYDPEGILNPGRFVGGI